jgi:hypothetical protein
MGGDCRDWGGIEEIDFEAHQILLGGLQAWKTQKAVFFDISLGGIAPRLAGRLEW